ncbi:MAG: hypothetical protein QNI93_01205 [Kiloniellales bacterium]|nr:hypothetical protein [Kiloniellales bacterium]
MTRDAEAAAQPMTRDELWARGARLYGAERWQSALSRELGVNPRTVRRWAAGTTPVPPPVATCLRLMTFLEELEWLGEWRKLIAEELRSGWYRGTPERRW